MAVKVAAVTIDCEDALVVGRFWSAALGRALDPNPTSEFASIGFSEHRDTNGWRLDEEHAWLFAQVPEPKTAKNRLHFDLRPSDTRAAEVARLEALGASVAEVFDSHTLMRDPEGNEFCVEPGPGDG